MKHRVALLLLRLLSAGILLQTLYFKFTGAPESVFIFSSLGVEPWGRYLSGITELLAATLILIPSTQAFGALLAFGIMVGAVLSHIFILGIAIQGDGGLLFGLGLCVAISCSAIIAFHRDELTKFAQSFFVTLKGVQSGKAK